MILLNTCELEREFVRRSEELGIDAKHRDKIMSLLEGLRVHHEPTYSHSLRVGLKASEIAEFMGLNPKPAFYGVLHDLGKTRVPLEVLGKERGFGEHDRMMMKGHTNLGYALLSKEHYLFSAWIALTHHRFQDKAYPIELPEKPEFLSDAGRFNLDLHGRVVALADQYDASHRINDATGGRALSDEEIRERMLKGNMDQSHLVERLYEEGIFGKNRRQY